MKQANEPMPKIAASGRTKKAIDLCEVKGITPGVYSAINK
jgi:hypothetical protein